ncbi:TetR/AcrR family transcriptional regulator [Paraburkholderia sp. BCC1885]|uniref:TetR/AcrR family transcriptional regulator n=1 Tax=Paraburkholderia sp. BCC1885 TaxID=2562669 RepID=UPI001183D012|nr:TetR/AcrR family transcriptional regulator [Paraburkholderia sp. BCC1885]
MNSKFPGKKAQSRQRILDAASRAVRRSGFHGVGVAEVMKEAGLTHGGFYSHFASREALLAEAVVHASREIGASITANVEALAKRGQSVFSAFVESYLSDSQISDCENGCPVAALCGEIASQDGEVLASSRRIVANLHRLVQQALPAGTSVETAWTVAGTLIGAMQLARALGDNKQGRAVLAAARADLIARYDNP